MGSGIAQCVAAKRGEDVALDSGETIPNGELTYLPYRGRSYAYLSDTLPSARAAGLVGGGRSAVSRSDFRRRG